MSIVVEIENTASLKKAKSLLGVKSDVETVELALEKVIEYYEPKIRPAENSDLPDEYWDDLFSEPMLPGGGSSQAIIDERRESLR